jgi:hypothetical protein
MSAVAQAERQSPAVSDLITAGWEERIRTPNLVRGPRAGHSGWRGRQLVDSMRLSALTPSACRYPNPGPLAWASSAADLAHIYLPHYLSLVRLRNHPKRVAEAKGSIDGQVPRNAANADRARGRRPGTDGVLDGLVRFDWVSKMLLIPEVDARLVPKLSRHRELGEQVLGMANALVLGFIRGVGREVGDIVGAYVVNVPPSRLGG